MSEISFRAITDRILDDVVRDSKDEREWMCTAYIRLFGFQEGTVKGWVKRPELMKTEFIERFNNLQTTYKIIV